MKVAFSSLERSLAADTTRRRRPSFSYKWPCHCSSFCIQSFVRGAEVTRLILWRPFVKLIQKTSPLIPLNPFSQDQIMSREKVLFDGPTSRASRATIAPYQKAIECSGNFLTPYIKYYTSRIRIFDGFKAYSQSFQPYTARLEDEDLSACVPPLSITTSFMHFKLPWALFHY